MTCAGCEALQAQVDTIWLDMDGYIAAERKYRREITRLNNELEKKAKRSRDAEVIERIAQHWRDKTGHTRAKVPVDSDRATAIWDRLEDGYTEAEWCLAIDYVGANPYQMYDRHLAAPVEGARKRDDLTYIGAKVSRFEGFIEKQRKALGVSTDVGGTQRGGDHGDGSSAVCHASAEAGAGDFT